MGGSKSPKTPLRNTCINGPVSQISLINLFHIVPFLKVSPDEKYYPGVNSLKKVKVSPPRQGNMYPDLTENFFNERPDTAMVGILCFNFSLNPLRFFLTRKIDTGKS